MNDWPTEAELRGRLARHIEQMVVHHNNHSCGNKQQVDISREGYIFRFRCGNCRRELRKPWEPTMKQKLKAAKLRMSRKKWEKFLE